MRVASSSAVRSNAGYEARLVAPSSAGSGTLQCTSSGLYGNSGQTSRTRSHSVITASNRSETNSSRCLVRLAPMSMPLLQDADRVRMQRPGMAPALAAWIAPADIRSSSASAIWERALFPVHRNNTRRGPPGSWTGRGHGWEPQCGMQRTACVLQRQLAGGQVDGVVGVAAVRRAPACGHEPTVAELTQVVRHQALRLVDQRRQLPDGAIALHQFSQQSPPHRVRRQTHERRRFIDSGARDLGCTQHTVPNERKSNQTELMRIWTSTLTDMDERHSHDGLEGPCVRVGMPRRRSPRRPLFGRRGRRSLIEVGLRMSSRSEASPVAPVVRSIGPRR